MVADPGAVDAAILAVLRADAELMAACPGGVYYAIAAPGVTNFVIVDRMVAVNDDAMYDGPACERYTYLAKAVIMATNSDVARAAALRIRTVLEQNDTLTIDGYYLQRPVTELEPIRETEVDEINPDRRVQHWGGQYEVTVGRT